MGAETKIQWTDATGGPWLGCTEISPGCARCYARELMQNRLGRGENSMVRQAYKRAGLSDWKTRPVWGDKAPRVMTKGFWDQMRSLDRKAEREKRRYRVFPSMIDWLDKMPGGIIDQDGEWMDRAEVLMRFLRTIYQTPNLDYLLLTKRPENFFDQVTQIRWGEGNAECSCDFETWMDQWLDGFPPANVWIGTSVEDQERWNLRGAEVLKIPARVRFLSVEPLLGPIEFSDVTKRPDCVAQLGKKALDGIDWVIAGGESGPKARPCDVKWIRSIVRQCRASGVQVFCKQLGAHVIDRNDAGFDGDQGDAWPMDTTTEDLDQGYQGAPVRVRLKDSKGGNMAEWPEDLRIRQWPEVER